MLPADTTRSQILGDHDDAGAAQLRQPESAVIVVNSSSAELTASSDMKVAGAAEEVEVTPSAPSAPTNTTTTTTTNTAASTAASTATSTATSTSIPYNGIPKSQRPRRVSSGVQFSERPPDIRTIPNCKRISRKQKSKQWCNEDDLEDAKNDCFLQIQRLQGSNNKKTISPSSLRGLEMFHEELAFQKARTSMHAVAAVLQEQYTQQRQHAHSCELLQTPTSSSAFYSNPDTISQAYIRRTESSRRSAADVAMLDRKEVQEYLQQAEEEVRQEHQRQAASNKRTSTVQQQQQQEQSGAGCFGMKWRNPFRKRT